MLAAVGGRHQKMWKRFGVLRMDEHRSIDKRGVLHLAGVERGSDIPHLRVDAIERSTLGAASDWGRLFVTRAHDVASVGCQKLLQMRFTVPKNFMSTL